MHAHERELTREVSSSAMFSLAALASALDTGTIDALVRRRTRLRATRLFSEGDFLKFRLEVAGVKLQDEVGGGTSWRAVALRPLAPRDAPSVLELAKRADDAPPADVARLAAEARALGAAALLGRSAADAAFAFALAGAVDHALFDMLADQQSAEFRRWRRAQPLATLQACERLVAAGLPPQHAVFATAAAVHEEGGCAQQAAAVRALRFDSTRSLLWLWRRAKSMRKVDAPSAVSSAAALSSVAFADPSLPLVVDLGCGFGTSLLGLLEHGLSGVGACNVLGCDASAAKMAFASGIAARRGHAPRAAFVSASASEVVAWLGREHEGRLGGVLVQFPTPFAVGGGNSQLPTGDGDGYMLSTDLLRAIKDAMTTSDGAFLLVQSNVEDVAVRARADAEAVGMHAVEVAGEEEGDDAAAAAPSLRRARLEASGEAVGRAQGSGWAAANPLGPHARSETEAAADFEGKRVHRVMLK